MSATAASAAPAVSIRGDARPDEAAHVRLEEFDGPLGLLLALIEQRQLDVLSVPLGDLAAAYVQAIGTLEADRLPHISAFVAVCSQLIVIKSRAILPRPPVIAAEPAADPLDPEAELRRRLLTYRAYRDAGARLADRLALPLSLVHREPTVAATAGLAGARPPQEPALDPSILVGAISGALRVVPPPPPPPEVVVRTVTLAERAAVIRRALSGASEVVLQDLLRGVTDRVVLAVTFLAMLELVKGHELAVEQEEPWGPIVCRRLEPRTRPSNGSSEA